MDLVSLSLAKKYTDEQISKIGTPADYIIEQGSNANGNWTKWNSGKMEVYGTASYSSFAITTPSAGFFTNNTTLQIPFAASFYEAPRVCILGVQGGNFLLWIRTGSGRSNEAPLTSQYTQGFRVCSPESRTVNNLVISYHAVGRWKA